MSLIKSLVIRDDENKLQDVGSRVQIAYDLGKKTFNGATFKVIDILGRFKYGYIVVYEFERSTISMSEGNGIKKISET